VCAHHSISVAMRQGCSEIGRSQVDFPGPKQT
jgi:hypothetical protein